MTESIIKGAEAQQNRVGAWYFSRLQPSGTLLAVAPSGEQYVVKGGNPHSPEFGRLFDAMVAALAVELSPDHPAVAPFIAAEREACADVADYWMGFDKTASEACEEIAQGIRERAELPDVSRQLAHHARAHLKCDGNHGGPRCADPECWNDSPDAPPETIETAIQARKAAQEQLYAARERHADEIKRLQAEIGRLLAAQLSTPEPTINWRGTHFTYQNQPCDNVTCWRLGEAARGAKPGGDLIDHGLSLLQQLQKQGFGVFSLAAKTEPANTSPQVPEGFALVPVEPTPAMKSAGIEVEIYNEAADRIGALTWHEVASIYRAMLDAARKEPSHG